MIGSSGAGGGGLPSLSPFPLFLMSVTVCMSLSSLAVMEKAEFSMRQFIIFFFISVLLMLIPPPKPTFRLQKKKKTDLRWATKKMKWLKKGKKARKIWQKVLQQSTCASSPQLDCGGTVKREGPFPLSPLSFNKMTAQLWTGNTKQMLNQKI